MFWCLRWRVCLIYCGSANNYLFGPSLVFFVIFVYAYLLVLLRKFVFCFF